MTPLSKLSTWLLTTMLGGVLASILFSVSFTLLARLGVPFFTNSTENPTYPFIPNAGWLALVVSALLSALLLLPLARRRWRQTAGLLYAGIVLFLPLRGLWHAGYSTWASDRLDWSMGNDTPILRGKGEWFATRLWLATEEYLVPTLAFAVAFAALLLVLDWLGYWLRRRQPGQPMVG
jgi:hypothetical protein